MNRFTKTLTLVVALSMSAGAAFAHTGTGAIGGFVSGFTHPIFGLDHLVAMVAVGLWGAFLGAPAIWVLPVVFPLIMACGGVLGILGCLCRMSKPGLHFRPLFSGCASSPHSARRSGLQR